MAFIIESLLVGTIQRFAGNDSSAIAKAAVNDIRQVGWLGIEGDAQADLSVHGGPDKAIHHYPHDHYAFWTTMLGAASILQYPGAFGENISTRGLTEDIACIGDRYRLGTALVEIAQGRQPCWKQAYRLHDGRTVATMVKTRRCGWYYRVIEEGKVTVGDTLRLVEQPYPDWTVARVIGLLIAGEAKRDPAGVRVLSQLSVLADNWRQRAIKLLR
jgi:MOSC domain-containing protein YiiM